MSDGGSSSDENDLPELVEGNYNIFTYCPGTREGGKIGLLIFTKPKI